MNYTTKEKPIINVNGASVDAFYGPWTSRSAFETWASDELGLEDIPDAVTIAVRNTDGTITKYVRENDAWREDGRVPDVNKSYVDTQLATKANVTALASALQSMASKTELQASLADKANASDLDDKADKSYVDAQLTAKANSAIVNAALAQKQDVIADIETIRSNAQLAGSAGTAAADASASAQQAATNASNAATRAQQAMTSASAVQSALNNLIVGDDIPAATVAQAASTAAEVVQLKQYTTTTNTTTTNTSFETEDGYYPCAVGSAIPDKTLISGYCCAKITNLSVGENYEIKGKSGNTSKILNYYKNGVCVSRSSESGNTEKTYNIVVDDTFDTLVVNSSKGVSPYIHKVTTTTIGVKQMLNDYKTEVNSQLYREVTDMSNVEYTNGGYYNCVSGEALPALTENASCYYAILTNIRVGEKIDISAESGKTSKIWNKFKNGVCVGRSSEGSMAIKTYQVTGDESFDTLVLNSYSKFPTAKRTYVSVQGIGDAIDSKISSVQTELNQVKNSVKTGLEGKKVVVIGDSSVCGGDNSNQWATKLQDVLGVSVKVFAKKGFTIRYNTSGCLATDMNVNFMNWVAQGNTPDIIILQMGGNDLPRMATNGGTVDGAFSEFNYEKLKNSEYTASSLRYHLELWRRTFPNAVIIVGTVLQRAEASDSTQGLAEIQRGVASRLGMYVADCNKEVGFSRFTEASPTNRYKDSEDAVSRTNPYFNYFDSNGNIVTSTDALGEGGVLKDGYTKRYGLYTYDGVHMIKQGEDIMTRFYANKLISISRFIQTD